MRRGSPVIRKEVQTILHGFLATTKVGQASIRILSSYCRTKQNVDLVQPRKEAERMSTRAVVELELSNVKFKHGGGEAK